MTLTMIFIGLLSGLGILFMLMKLDFWKVLGFDLYVDIAATALLMILYAGTLGGMVAAMVGGLQISVVLWSIKKLFGYLRPTVTRKGWKISVSWKTVPGVFYNRHMGAKGYYTRQQPSHPEPLLRRFGFNGRTSGGW